MRVIRIVFLVIFLLVGIVFCAYVFKPNTIGNVIHIHCLEVWYKRLLGNYCWWVIIEKNWTYFLGYFFGIVVGSLCIRGIIHEMWECCRSTPRSEPWQPTIIGIFESILYLGAIHANIAHFIIPAWLIFKIAGKWKSTKGESAGRLINNIFLAGTLLNLIFAALGAYFGKYLKGQELHLTLFVFGVMLAMTSIGTLAMMSYLWYLSRRPNRRRSWGRIRTHLRMENVRDILGEPDRIETIGCLVNWYYYINEQQQGSVSLQGSQEDGYYVYTHRSPF